MSIPCNHANSIVFNSLDKVRKCSSCYQVMEPNTVDNPCPHNNIEFLHNSYYDYYRYLCFNCGASVALTAIERNTMDPDTTIQQLFSTQSKQEK